MTSSTAIPKTHPRAESLMIRQRLVSGFERGLVAAEGLLAHGRGEAFDYLVGEQTIKPARDAIRAAAACLLLAKRPVISVNGNFAALCPGETVLLAEAAGAGIEVNIFYGGGDDGRRDRIIAELCKNGARRVMGGDMGRNIRLSGLDNPRRTVDRDGIYAADTVLIPLEDGDRTEALVRMGKTVISFDLNPMSRTSQTSSITIVDNVVRGMPALADEVQRLAGAGGGGGGDLAEILKDFDNKRNLGACMDAIGENLTRSGRGQAVAAGGGGGETGDA